VETFEYAGPCRRRDDPVRWKRLTECDDPAEPEEPEEGQPTVEQALQYDYPECVRENDEVEVRRVYDPARDGWLAPSGGA